MSTSESFFCALSNRTAPFSISFYNERDWSSSAQGSQGNFMSVFQMASCQSGDRVESHRGNSLYCRTKEHHFIIHLVYMTGAQQWNEVARREVCVLWCLFMGHVSSYCCCAGRSTIYFFHNKQAIKSEKRKNNTSQYAFFPNLDRDSFYSISYGSINYGGRQETFKVCILSMLLTHLDRGNSAA